MRRIAKVVSLASLFATGACNSPPGTDGGPVLVGGQASLTAEPTPRPAEPEPEPEPESKPRPRRVDPAATVTLVGVDRSQTTEGPPSPYVAFEVANPTDQAVELKLREVRLAPDEGASVPVNPPWNFEIGTVGIALQPDSPTTIAGEEPAEVPPGETRRIVVHYANPKGFPRSAFPYSVRAVFIVDGGPLSAVAQIRRAHRHRVR